MQQIESLIGKYISGEANTAEKAEVKQWLSESEENKVVFQQIKNFWEESHENLSKVEQSSWQKLSNHIDFNGSAINETPVKPIPKNSKPYLYWAAAIAFILTSVFLFWNANYYQSINHIAKIIESNADYGSKVNIRLADGTQVKLNSGSKLTYPEEFTGNERRVTLTGEAFFDVAKNPQKPFVITTGNINTTVLGTSFNVQASSLSEVKVAVLTGKVKVTDTLNQQQVFLLPEDLATVQTANGNISKTKFDATLVFGWKDGKLVFKEASLKEVLNQLEKWFGFTFEKSIDFNEPTTHDYYSVFQNESLTNVMENLSHTFDFKYQIDYQNKKVLLMN
ncbi:FecR family protein [Chondrinema litorale]|uniref:FecR family protein n=1 Tax=Chondrinema litorale TaxID=2994555 RepID=UPI002542E2AD|nr:FecR family protein [Chondrinema litorale]UZR98173.1 FecR domain-containing protein [Chondrinema litorale]